MPALQDHAERCSPSVTIRPDDERGGPQPGPPLASSVPWALGTEPWALPCQPRPLPPSLRKPRSASTLNSPRRPALNCDRSITFVPLLKNEAGSSTSDTDELVEPSPTVSGGLMGSVSRTSARANARNSRGAPPVG